MGDVFLESKDVPELKKVKDDKDFKIWFVDLRKKIDSAIKKVRKSTEDLKKSLKKAEELEKAEGRNKDLDRKFEKIRRKIMQNQFFTGWCKRFSDLLKSKTLLNDIRNSIQGSDPVSNKISEYTGATDNLKQGVYEKGIINIKNYYDNEVSKKIFESKK